MKYPFDALGFNRLGVRVKRLQEAGALRRRTLREGSRLRVQAYQMLSFGGPLMRGRGPSGCRPSSSIISLRATNGAVVSTDWLTEENFSDAVRSVMGLYASSIMAKILIAVKGHGLIIGQLQLSNHGIAFASGIIFKKQHAVTWADAETQVAYGNVQISSRSDPKAQTTLACRDYWNACLLPFLIEIMKSSAK